MKLSKSFFKKTFLLIVSTLMVVVTLFSLSLIINQKNTLNSVIFSNAKTISKTIALVSSGAMNDEDLSFIVEYMQRFLEDNNEIKYIIFHRKDAEIIYSDNKKWSFLSELPKQIVNLEKNEITSSVLKTDLYPTEVYHFKYPILFSGITWGWIDIGFSRQEYLKSMKSIYLNSFILLTLTFITSIILSYYLTKWLVKPIIDLSNASKKVTSGDLNVQVKVNGNDEISQLAISFNKMTNSLKDSYQKLSKSNEDLEQRVKNRTEELNRLNRGLDLKVKEESNKRAEQEQLLIHQSRFAAMGEMIGNIAHQWRQPLNALSLLLQNIENAHEMGKLDDDYIKRKVEKGHRLTNNMSQTIDDFRNFFRPNKVLEQFTISEAINSTLDIIRTSLEHSMIEIIQQIDSNKYTKGHKSEFSQVLLNIINNAKDALIEKDTSARKIWIDVFDNDELIIVKIKDNAGGIKDSVIGKIFDPYFTTKDEGKGTGIGLYMSKTIIENNMNGKLSVQNSEDGVIFTISIKSIDKDNTNEII